MSLLTSLPRNARVLLLGDNKAAMHSVSRQLADLSGCERAVQFIGGGIAAVDVRDMCATCRATTSRSPKRKTGSSKRSHHCVISYADAPDGDGHEKSGRRNDIGPDWRLHLDGVDELALISATSLASAGNVLVHVDMVVLLPNATRADMRTLLKTSGYYSPENQDAWSSALAKADVALIMKRRMPRTWENARYMYAVVAPGDATAAAASSGGTFTLDEKAAASDLSTTANRRAPSLGMTGATAESSMPVSGAAAPMVLLGASRSPTKYARRSGSGASTANAIAHVGHPRSVPLEAQSDGEIDASENETEKEVSTDVSVPVSGDGVDTLGGAEEEREEQEDGSIDKKGQKEAIATGNVVARCGDQDARVDELILGARETTPFAAGTRSRPRVKSRERRECGGGGGGGGGAQRACDNVATDDGGESDWEKYDPAAYGGDVVIATVATAEDVKLPQTRPAFRGDGAQTEQGLGHLYDATDEKRGALHIRRARGGTFHMRVVMQHESDDRSLRARNDATKHEPLTRGASRVRDTRDPDDRQKRAASVDGKIKRRNAGGASAGDDEMPDKSAESASDADQDEEAVGPDVGDDENEKEWKDGVRGSESAATTLTYARVPRGPKCAMVILRATSSTATLYRGAYHSSAFEICDTCATLVCTACLSSHRHGPRAVDVGQRVCALARYVK